LGPVVLLAVIVHKMPDSMSISSILLAAGWNRRKVAILNLLFSLTTPIGALLAFLFFRSLAPENVAFAIGISAGTFLAIATADILPQVHRIEQRNPTTLLFLLAGLSVTWLGKLLCFLARREERSSRSCSVAAVKSCICGGAQNSSDSKGVSKNP